MEFKNFEVEPIFGISVGLEYENDYMVYGDENVHYILLNFFILRFILIFGY